MANYKSTVIDLQNIQEHITPNADDTASIGSQSNKWAGIHIGPDSIYIEDQTTGETAAVTVDNGVFNIDGIAQAQLPDLAVTNLTFNDETVQTTAAAQSDWDATSGPAQILNKPDISGATPPVETDYVVGGGTSGTQPVFDGDPLFEGSYVEQGPLVYFRVNVDMDNITQFGSGQYFITLPFASKYDYVTTNGHLHDTSSTKDYMIIGEVDAGSSQMNLFYTDTTGQSDEFTQSSPIGLQSVDFFHISGSYIAE